MGHRRSLHRQCSLDRQPDRSRDSSRASLTLWDGPTISVHVHRNFPPGGGSSRSPSGSSCSSSSLPILSTIARYAATAQITYCLPHSAAVALWFSQRILLSSAGHQCLQRELCVSDRAQATCAEACPVPDVTVWWQTAFLRPFGLCVIAQTSYARHLKTCTAGSWRQSSSRFSSPISSSSRDPKSLDARRAAVMHNLSRASRRIYPVRRC